MVLNFIRQALQNTSFVLLLIILFALLLGDRIPLTGISFCYAISMTIKEILIFVLPVVIFTYLSSCILSLKQGAATFILVLMTMVMASNFFSILTAYLAQAGDFVSVTARSAGTGAADVLIPTWTFSLPKVLGNDYALMLGLAVGMIFSYRRWELVDQTVQGLKKGVDFFMNRLFIPVLPMFILGFVLKLKYEGLLAQILEEYAPVLGVIIALQIAYLFVLYTLAAWFQPQKALRYIRQVLPAALAGFTTMSSAAAMPVSIKAAEHNTGNGEMARAIIPATMNIHMIGDSIAISIMVMVILRTFGYDAMNFSDYLTFTAYFMIAKFAIAAVPGGSILVMVPILESKLGFTGEMSALATALYILFDPIITAANVSGNGAFAVLFNKVLGWQQRQMATS